MNAEVDRPTNSGLDGQTMVWLLAVAGLLISASIGYAYARSIWVDGWQLWTWLICVVLVVAGLLVGAGRPPVDIRSWLKRHSWWLLLVILLLALLLRATFLNTIPGGLHVDEVGVADFSLRHVFPETGQTINPFRSGPASQPSLYHYLVRLALAIGGRSIAGLRLSSALAGTVAVLATYLLIATFDTRRMAIIAAVIMAAYHFHIQWSRIGLNNIWDTLWVPLMLTAFYWGWRRRWAGGAVLAGLALGLSQYFYAGSRLGILLLAAIVWHLWRTGRKQARDAAADGEPLELLETRRELLRRMAVYTGRMGLVAACAAAPLVFFAILDPAPFFERSRVVFGWTPELIRMVTGQPDHYLAYGWHQLWRAAGAFTTVPDVTGFYGPGVPLLIGLSGPLFVVGLLWTIYRRSFLPVLWIVLTVFFGGIMLGDPPGSSHYVIAIPAICWLVATPISWLVSSGRAWLALVVLLAVVIPDLVFYFVIYVPGSPRDLIHAFPS
jgi:hypothetical protein